MKTAPKLILLDRDGTLNERGETGYILTPDELVLRPGAREACQLIKAAGIPMALVTKQRCIEKGFVTREQVGIINGQLAALLGVDFSAALVESDTPTKARLFEAFARTDGVVLFDDSVMERAVAGAMGIRAYDGSNLLAAVKEVLP